MGTNGQHAHTGQERRRRRTRTILLLVGIGLVAFGGGFLVANLSEADEAAPTVSGTPSSTPSEVSTSESSTPEPTGSQTPTSPAPLPIADGRHFVRPVSVEGSDPAVLTYDLAYFLTGDEANAAAAEHGDEVPVPNDVYIVNDNPKLRAVPIAPDATVEYIPANLGELRPGDLDEWIGAVNGEQPPDYQGFEFTWWWITVQGGEVVAIEQQYLP